MPSELPGGSLAACAAPALSIRRPQARSGGPNGRYQAADNATARREAVRQNLLGVPAKQQ